MTKHFCTHEIRFEDDQQTKILKVGSVISGEHHHDCCNEMIFWDIQMRVIFSSSSVVFVVSYFPWNTMTITVWWCNYGRNSQKFNGFPGLVHLVWKSIVQKRWRWLHNFQHHLYHLFFSNIYTAENEMRTRWIIMYLFSSNHRHDDKDDVQT